MVRAGELTLDQLANLQAIRDDAWPDPLDVDGLRTRLDAMEDEPRRVALVAAHEAAEAGPDPWRGPKTDDELRAFILIALEPHNDGFGMADAAAIVEQMTAPEYNALLRTTAGITPLDEIEVYLGLDRSSGGGGEPIPWAQAVCEVMEVYPGMTLEAIGRLTVSQVKALRSGGKPSVRGVPVPMDGAAGSDSSLRRMVREARRKFHGTDTAKGAG